MLHVTSKFLLTEWKETEKWLCELQGWQALILKFLQLLTVKAASVALKAENRQSTHTQSLGLLGCLKQESLLWVSIQLPSNIALHLHVHVTVN